MLLKPVPFTRTLLLLSAVFTGASAGFAQRAAARAYFYTEPDFRGEVFVVEAGSTVNNLEFIRDSRGRPFNDRISSVQLEGPIRVTIFQHADFRGSAMWLNRDARDLDTFPIDAGRRDAWGRAISSVQVEALAVGAPPFSRWERREAERIVRVNYLECFGREPDSVGIRFYSSRLLDAGWSEPQLRDALRRSPEFRDRDLDAIIRRVYHDVLGRAPDDSGLATYRRSLSRGMTEGEMRVDLARSREGNEKRVHEAVTRAYREILKREPDPGGFEAFSKQMLQKGWSESDVRDALRGSEEYRKLRGR